MRSSIALLAVVMLATGCSSSSSPTTSSDATPAPTQTPPPASSPAPSPASTLTISIVGSSGGNAYVPNPASGTPGTAVSWKNNDASLHHIVLDNGTVVGDIAPGTTSRSVTVTSGTVNYVCTIHPSMVGSINATAGVAAAPSSDSPY
jgi:plastocyanin